ncbi:hypothetical protein [Luteimonas mephitis]|jgi:hypothetical protein|uniref:hypothetical protein n=1 Tax=Luteimonas mephitis TaxID=83615 RepID=UPI003A8D8A92
MSIRPFLLPLIAAGMLSLASAGAWAQDSGRGHDRGQAGQGDRGGRGDAVRDAPRQRPMMGEARPPEPRQQEARRQRRDDEMADSVRRIERSTRGRVINAERVQSDGRDVNRIKVMDERGRIRVYMDDPQQRNRPPTRDDDN